MPKVLKKMYVLKWSYLDGSDSGVLPFLYTVAQASLVSETLKKLGDDCNQKWEFVETKEVPE